MLSTDISSAKVLARTAHELVSNTDGVELGDRVVRSAQSLLESEGVAIWAQVTPKKLRLVACTEPEISAEMARITNATNGIVWDCLRQRDTVHTADLQSESRWPDYCALVTAHTAVRSAVAYHLMVEQRDVGVLVLYSSTPAAYDTEQVEVGSVFASHVALVLDHSNTAARADHLERALQSNRRIGIAIGILMSSQKITDEQAFDLLRSASQHRGVKLHQVAELVVQTGALPGDTP